MAVTDTLPHLVVGVTAYFLWWRGWRASLALPTLMGAGVVLAVAVMQLVHAVVDAVIVAPAGGGGNVTAARIFADALHSHIPCEYAALTVALALYVARPLLFQWKPHWQPSRTPPPMVVAVDDPLEGDYNGGGSDADAPAPAEQEQDDDDEDPPPATLPALPSVFDVAISKMSERECVARLAVIAAYVSGMLWARARATGSAWGVAVGAVAGAVGFYVTERVALRPGRAVFIKHD